MKARTLIFKHLMIFFCLLSLPALSNAAAVRVAILPFDVQAGKDHVLLQKHITDLLTYRLAKAGGVEIIAPKAAADASKSMKGLSGDSLALMVAAKLQANYALYGSVTPQKDGVLIESRMLNVTGQRAAVNFSSNARDTENVIPVVNQLANDIIAKILNLETNATATEPTAQPAHSASELPTSIKQNRRSPIAAENPSPGAGTGILNPAFVTTSGRAEQNDFLKGPDLDYLINGLAVGDINQDGLQETITITPEKVIIAQTSRNQTHTIAEIDSPRFTINVGVDAADINANGIAEIFVTALNSRRNALASYVIEHNGARFNITVKSAPWYFRIIPDPQRGHILLGQGQRFGRTPFFEPIMELQWKKKDYRAVKKILEGDRANLMGFAMGDIFNDNSSKVLAFTQRDRLRAMTANGDRIWTGTHFYGGSPIYFALPPASPGDGPGSFYLPVRIVLTDMDRDGKQEIIVPSNIDTAQRKLAAQRFYREGKLAALRWDGLGLVPVWETRKFSGRIQDLAIADFDNDGADELVTAVISREGAVIGTKARSTLIAFELNRP